MTRMNKGVRIAAAATTLVLNGAVLARAEDKPGGDEVTCYDINECTSQGSCARASNSRTGKNECKGEGFLGLSKLECEQKGGKVIN